MDMRDEEMERLRAQIAEAENAITWGVSCLACSRVLDSCIRETERAEKAETAVARARALADRWCREPHPTHDHSCPDDVRRELLAALDDTAGT